MQTEKKLTPKKRLDCIDDLTFERLDHLYDIREQLEYEHAKAEEACEIIERNLTAVTHSISTLERIQELTNG